MLLTQQALDHAIDALCGLDSLLVTKLLAIGGRPLLRRREPGFEGLAWIVVSQQVSTASATAIFARLKAKFPDISAESIAAANSEALRLCGLSAPKCQTLHAIAEAVALGHLDFAAMRTATADGAHDALVSIKGIGPWTADVFLLFCLGHSDAWPAGDLALQEAARFALDLETRPTEKAMRALGDRWRPWRGAAAYLLWASYRERKLAMAGSGAAR